MVPEWVLTVARIVLLALALGCATSLRLAPSRWRKRGLLGGAVLATGAFGWLSVAGTQVLLVTEGDDGSPVVRAQRRLLGAAGAEVANDTRQTLLLEWLQPVQGCIVFAPVTLAPVQTHRVDQWVRFIGPDDLSVFLSIPERRDDDLRLTWGGTPAPNHWE